MELDNLNEEWRKEAPLLAAMEPINPFSVPDKYFENLIEIVKASAAIDHTVNVSKETFLIPGTYFQDLEERIMSSVKINDFKELTDGDGFSVPHLYFDDLQKNILAKVSVNEPSAKAVIKRLPGTWIRYAAAACITAIVAAGLLLNSHDQSIDNQLSQLPEEEIINYLQIYSTTGDGEIIAEHLENNNNLPDTEMELSDQEIKQYLESTL